MPLTPKTKSFQRGNCVNKVVWEDEEHRLVLTERIMSQGLKDGVEQLYITHGFHCEKAHEDKLGEKGWSTDDSEQCIRCSDRALYDALIALGATGIEV